MARKIAVEIVGDSRSLERAFGRSSKSARDFNRSVSRTGRSTRAFGGLTRSVGGLAGAFIGTYGLTTAVRAAFDEMGQAQKVSAQTEAALKSTGAAANVSAKHIDDLASSLMNLSGQDDETIHKTENLLLTFTKIRNEAGKGNDIFDQATKAVVDLSTALDEDMGSAAIQVGKALNDPIKGVTALRRVGVQFSDAQVKLIKRLVETGHTLDAQKVILRELNKEFGGSAEAAGKTLPGRLNLLRETALNLAGAIAQTLAPAITKVINQLIKWLQNNKNQKQVLDTVKQAAAAVTDIVRVLRGALEALNKITGSTKRSLELLFGALVAYKGLKLLGALSNIASNIGLIGTRARTSTGSVRGLAGSLKGLVPLAIGAAAALGGMRQQTQKIRIQTPGGKIITATGTVPRGDRPTIGGIPYVRGPGGVYRPAAGGVVVHGGVHLHGVQNVRQMEQELAKRQKGRAHNRRGAR